jgi:hypothetical protein
MEICYTFAIPNRGKIDRELSSAGSEHLPYKQRVGGSNPTAPTKEASLKVSFPLDAAK